MRAVQLISQLRSLGIELAAADGRLRVTAARSALTENLKREIAQHKSELLQLLADGDRPQEVRAVLREGVLPLSSFQTRLWVIHRLFPDSAAYNMVTFWLHSHETDAEPLMSSVRALLQENEILRASFRDDGGGPGVSFLAPADVQITVRDLRGLGELSKETIVQNDRLLETQRPFNLAAEAPTRWTLYQIEGRRWGILLAAHHIALDEWSLTLLRRRIENPHSRSSSQLQYVDYAAWQETTQNQALLQNHLGWWEKQLLGIPQLCTFPTDRTSRNNDFQAGSTRSFCWPPDLVVQVRRLIQREGVTLYMALVSVCAAVLRAYTGQSDIVFGCPMGTRERPEFETMLGPFVNHLVLRLDLSDDPSFIDLLVRTRGVFLDAYDHRDVPFEMLVDRLAPPRSFDRPPLCQVAVVLHNSSSENAPSIYSGGSINDLTWYARETNGRIEGSIEYRTDLYDDATIDRLINHLETFLRAALSNPECKISRISLLTEAERRTLIDEFNRTGRDTDRDGVSVKFERQAAARPGKPAVTFNGNQLSYGELNRRSNQLARLLLSRGVGRGARVGVALERSLNMLVALLGAQKAGAAYVPIDPQFPMDRVQFMLADSAVGALIASRDSALQFGLPADVAVIDLEIESTTLESLEASDLAAKAAPDDLVYVIYTSGSTGRPNGVAVTHGALANFLEAMLHEPGLRETDIIAAVTTISFDIAALELYLPLIAGAQVELISRDVAVDGGALARHLNESGTTVLQATPATWRLLIEANWRAPMGFRAFCGGESMPRDVANQLLAHGQELWNLYGPTETTVWSTAGRVEHSSDEISIGRPIANTAIYILDGFGEPTAIGIPGEIWIGGDGVATGYHNRPELTAARFVSDPFREGAGARMYRTGDLGRWGGDGRLFHLGRLDRQVKFRGFRVELGEIESVLQTNPYVARATVIARDLTDEHPRLVAYIVYHPGKELTATEARRHIRQSLPDYMVPSAFVALETLPLTPNGKIDVRALPDPFRNSAAGLEYQQPKPGLEQQVAEIWQEVLHIDKVSADDNFFEVGGSSLLSLRVVTKIEALVGRRLQPRALFFQNLRQFAASVRLAEVRPAHDR